MGDKIEVTPKYSGVLSQRVVQNMCSLLDSSSPATQCRISDKLRCRDKESLPWDGSHKHLGPESPSQDLEQVTPIMQSKERWSPHVEAVQSCKPSISAPVLAASLDGTHRDTGR